MFTTKRKRVRAQVASAYLGAVAIINKRGWIQYQSTSSQGVCAMEALRLSLANTDIPAYERYTLRMPLEKVISSVIGSDSIVVERYNDTAGRTAEDVKNLFIHTADDVTAGKFDKQLKPLYSVVS